MIFAYRCVCVVLLLAPIVLLPMVGADDAALPPNSIDSPEGARELAVAAKRFMYAIGPRAGAKYL